MGDWRRGFGEGGQSRSFVGEGGSRAGGRKGGSGGWSVGQRRGCCWRSIGIDCRLFVAGSGEVACSLDLVGRLEIGGREEGKMMGWRSSLVGRRDLRRCLVCGPGGLLSFGRPGGRISIDSIERCR
jgi:hypothetical protein